MTTILIYFYNIILITGIYPKRWLKLLDVILEKGKGPIIGKLRMIQLYEADQQILMRLFLGGREDNAIEKDYRISKFNYGSRSNYSI